jgi:hypothetical protein
LRAAKQNKNKDTIIVIDGIVNIVGARETEREKERERESKRCLYKRRSGKIQNGESSITVNPSRERVVLTLQQSLFVKRIRFVMRNAAELFNGPPAFLLQAKIDCEARMLATTRTMARLPTAYQVPVYRSIQDTRYNS